MTQRVLVYWHGIVGVPGKGPNWVERYDPDRTIGELVQTMTAHRLNDGKRIEIFKFKPGDMSKYDKGDPYWARGTKLSDYVQAMGGARGGDVMLVYVCV